MKRKVTKGAKIALCQSCHGTGLAEVPADVRFGKVKRRRACARSAGVAVV